MKTITLTKGYIAVIDDCDFDRVSQHSWYASDSGNGVYYAKSSSIGYMHRFIMDAPRGLEVDHADRDKLNNCRYNLRIATSSQNNFNLLKRINALSRYKGVSASSQSSKVIKPWHARIRASGKQHHLGYFWTEEEAAEAYNIAAAELFGEFARLNVVEVTDTSKKDAV